jgi:hypothetical protein
MKEYLSYEELCLLKLLKGAITDKGEEIRLPAPLQWEKLFEIAREHAVLSLLYEEVVKIGNVPKALLETAAGESRTTVLQSYRLLFLTRYLTHRLETEGIKVVVMKGSSLAGLYPVPELRKSGDIDLLLVEPKQLSKACHLLKKDGYIVVEEQHANHHTVLRGPEKIDIEIHTMLAEPFDNRKINRYMQRLSPYYKDRIVRESVMGVEIPCLPQDCQAYEMLLHMLQHFLRSGFGLKLLCDWSVFWNQPVKKEARESYLKLVEESGLKGFSDMVTAVCVYRLGLDKKAVRFMFEGREKTIKKQDLDLFLREILDGGEFGKLENDRMVVLRGTRLSDYFREFHHQMQLNYQKAGKIVIIWPALWLMTLFRFLKNNKKLRKIPTWKILRKAGKRSKLMEEMHLFRKTGRRKKVEKNGRK